MTVSALPRKAQHTANGVTTTFAVGFKFFEVDVYNGSNLVPTTDYNLNQVAPGEFGDVVFNTAPLAGSVITIVGATLKIQNTDYVDNDDFPAETHELGLDRLTMIVQEICEALAYTVRTPVTSDPTDIVDLSLYPGHALVVSDSGSVVPFLPNSNPNGGLLAIDSNNQMQMLEMLVGDFTISRAGVSGTNTLIETTFAFADVVFTREGVV